MYRTSTVTGTQLKGLAGALECTEIKDIQQYRSLCEDKKELVWVLDEATEVKHQEVPGSNRDPTKGPSLGILNAVRFSKGQ